MTKRLLVAGAMVLTLATAVAHADSGQATVPRVSGLALSSGEDDLLRLALKSAGTLRAVSCRVSPGGRGDRLLLEIPEVESGLNSSYEFPEMAASPVLVSPIPKSEGGGIRLELPLSGASLRGWEMTQDGLVILISKAPETWKENPVTAYLLGVGDRLDISVYGQEDLQSLNIEVLADGTAVFPMAGILKVAGKTLIQLREELEMSLKEYLVDPQVSANIKEYQSQSVNVVGEVAKPGKYYLKGSTNLIDIVAQAGWLTESAGNTLVITRGGGAPGKGGGQRQVTIRKEALLGGDLASNPTVLAGDIVTVGPKQVFYIRGEIAKPGMYNLESNLTLSKAVSIAEGLTPYARKRGIQILRTVEGVQTRTEVDLKAIEERKTGDVPLLPDDVIVIPRRLF